MFIIGLDDHGGWASAYIIHHKKCILDFCTLSCQHHKWMTQLDTIEKHNHLNHQNPKIIYTKSFYMFYMFMITVKIIFTVFWLFLLTFEGYFVQQNCNSRTAKLLTPSRQMFRFDYLTSRLNIHISGKITTFTVLKKIFLNGKISISWIYLPT